jgi:CubicO group peptidase (beta-lactamase class C family)
MRCFLLFLASWVANVVLHGATPYTPPRFEDPDRVRRIREVLPRLDALYADHAATNHIPGYVYGVLVDGELIHRRAAGVAETASGRPVGLSTRFRIASMSKSFTAAAILRLRDLGKLSLEDPVSRHLPEFRRVKAPTADSPVITIRHLLRMSGGFPQDDPWGDRKLAETDAQLDALVREGLTFSNPPGIRWEYSNLGYTLLGRIVTRVARMPYQRYVTREILQPLGMTNTVYEIDAVPSGELAHGYRWQDGAWLAEPMLHDGAWGAMGGMVTTLDDFARYAAFHLDAWPPRDEPDRAPLRRATRREMHRPWEVVTVPTDLSDLEGKPVARAAGYSTGLSWNQDSRGIIWVRHAGGLPGFGSEFRFLPDHGVALIAFGNRTYAPMTAANVKAMEVLVGAARIPARTVVPSPILARRAGQVARLLQDWDSAADREALASNFFLDHPETEWRRKCGELLAKTGPIVEVTPLTAENQLRGRFRLRGAKGSVEVFLTLMPEKEPKVQEVTVTFREPGKP